MSTAPTNALASLVTAFDIVGSRRDVRCLTAVLHTIEPGARAAASFRSSLFGPHVFTGTVTRSEAIGALTIAGQSLESSGALRAPVPELLTLTTVDEDEDERTSVTPYPGQVHDAIDELSHGDLVKACFEQHPYGSFSVTGFALRAPTSNVFVVGGGWFVTEPHQRVPADRLIDLTLLSPASQHDYPVPQPIHRWPEPD
ncbi:hypothetical protein ACFXO9_34705 [Nocardia tengchongensis]|uniref:hypothetical protein n=1 Tax=Nocardia tengchongensis TaxID=2055889 RepID=UPI003694AEE9